MTQACNELMSWKCFWIQMLLSHIATYMIKTSVRLQNYFLLLDASLTQAINPAIPSYTSFSNTGFKCAVPAESSKKS